MSSISKTKRVALSWDQEFKNSVKDLEDYLARATGANSISNSDVFMLCLAIGFELKKVRPVPPRKSDAVRLQYLKEPQIALMRSIALTHEKDYTVLLNEDKVYDVVEQYAAGGLEVLAVEMKQQNDFVGYLTKMLYKQIKEVNSSH